LQDHASGCDPALAAHYLWSLSLQREVHLLNLFYLLEQVLLGAVGKSAWWQLLKG